MCKVTHKIKFCTCLDENIDVEELNHYWVLHRYNKDKNMNIMGEPVFPSHLHPMFKFNESILVDTLNEDQTFDKNIELEKGDRLEVVLCNNSDNDSLYYNFKFTGKTWKSIESDTFDLISNFDEVKGGEIKEITFNNYGAAAIEAAKASQSPIEAWQTATEKIFNSTDSQSKSCPKNAFLGLCEAGLIKNIEAGSYFKMAKPNINKEYAITAVNILSRSPELSRKELWKQVKKELLIEKKSHNSQMDVVLALWNTGLIVKQE